MQRQTRVLILSLTGCLGLQALYHWTEGHGLHRLAEASQGPPPEPEVGATSPEVCGPQNKNMGTFGKLGDEGRC